MSQVEATRSFRRYDSTQRERFPINSKYAVEVPPDTTFYMPQTGNSVMVSWDQGGSWWRVAAGSYFGVRGAGLLMKADGADLEVDYTAGAASVPLLIRESYIATASGNAYVPTPLGGECTLTWLDAVLGPRAENVLVGGEGRQLTGCAPSLSVYLHSRKDV